MELLSAARPSGFDPVAGDGKGTRFSAPVPVEAGPRNAQETKD